MSKKPSPSHNQPVWTTTIDYRPPPQEEDRDIEERPVSRHTYYYNNVEYENENLNQGYIEDDSNRRRFQRAFDEDSEFVERHTNISIPRPKVYGRSGRETPDDFNFLEDRQLADYAQVSKKHSVAYAPQRYRPNCWLILNVIQIFVAIFLLIFAFFRFFRIFSQSNQNVLYDFIKAEDSAQTNQGGTEIIALKLGSSLFIPASLQLISGFSGLWPMGERGNYSCLIIHVIFSMLAIIYWFEPINYAALELNLRTEQLDSELSSLSYGVLLTLLVLGSLIVLLVTSLTMCNAILVLSEPCNVSHSHVDVHLGMATVIISVVCSALSVYVSSSTLRSVTNWVNPTLKNTVLYGFGLRELIITIYITLATGLCSVSTMTQQRNLRLAALILQLISLLLIFGHLLTADRITAVTHNIKVMFSVGLNRPVGPESILLLYTFIVILAILLVAHTISTIINLCKKCSLSEPLNRNLYSQHVEDVPEASNYRANL